jgi:signal peptidase II
MEQPKKNIWPYFLLVLILILIDQWSKIYVKTHFYLGEEVIVIPNWFRLSFTENQGVAFGMEWGGELGKYILSIFRIVFSVFIAYFLTKKIVSGEKKGVLIAGSLILAGAIGNVIDGVFYGAIFSNSSYHMSNVATWMPFGHGYSSVLQGKVVDFFYFPLINSVFPDWIPVIGGQPFSFFNAIFNVADSCISIGLGLFLINLPKTSDLSS